MPGLNLSQSMTGGIGEKKNNKDSLFDTGFIVSFFIFVIVAGSWGALNLYISQLNKKINALDAVVAQHTTELQSGSVDRVADFDMRLRFLADKAPERIDTNSILSDLESRMVTSVELLQYEYNKQDKVVTFMARTDNFRHVAEQIISLKESKMFSEVKVDSVKREKDGKITFTLKAHF